MNKLIVTLIGAVAVLTACNRNAQKYDASGTFEVDEVIVSAEQSGNVPPRHHLSHQKPLHVLHIVRCTEHSFCCGGYRRTLKRPSVTNRYPSPP